MAAAAEAMEVQIASGADAVVAAWLRGFQVRKRMKVSEWAQAKRKLPEEGSARPGNWDNDVNPLLVEPMDALGDDHPCTYVTIRKSIQSGGTEVALNWIGWSIDESPTSLLVVMDVIANAKLLSEQRLDPMIVASPDLASKISPARERDSGNTKLQKKFSGGILKLAGSNSTSSLRSMPVQRLVLDEKDKYVDDLDDEGNPADLAEGRTSTYTFRRKILNISSPKIKDASLIDRDYEAGDQSQYWICCPSCGGAQTLKDTQLRDDATYLCEVGGCTIREAEKKRFLSPKHGARWIPRYPERSNFHRSFTWSALYTPLGLGYSWADIVKMRAEAATDVIKLKTYVNTILGESYEDAATKIEAKDLSSRAGTWKMREVPKGCLVITAAVDVQGNRFACTALGWGRHGKVWWLDYVELPGNPTVKEDWKVVDDWRARPFVNRSGVSIRISACGVDSGNWTHDVYDYCRTRQHEGVFALKGHRWGGKPVIGKPKLQDVKISGRTIKQGVKLWVVGVDTAKTTVMGWLLSDGEMLMGAEPDPAKLRVNFPEDLPEEVYKMLSAERYDPELKRWVKIKGRRNEALDDFVYGFAASCHPLVRVHTYREADWAALEAKLEPEADLFTPAGTTPVAAPATPVVSRETSGGGFGTDDWNSRGFK